jgi:ERCC4-type nuclease
MLIKIDFRETELFNKISSLLPKENITIETDNLPLGDIIIYDNDGNEKVIIERKTLQDLASSIRDGRYKEQSFRLNECNVHNHNIIYLIEGNLQHYKPFGKNGVDKSALMSSMVSISYYKGFSLYKSNNIDESAEWILQFAFKLNKEGGNSFYLVNNASINLTDTDTNATDTNTINTNNDTNYSSVLKRSKKINITPDNIGEIMLGQIPNVSNSVAIVIMEKFKTIKNLIEALTLDKNVLNGLTTINKSGQTRKISKTSIENIYKYII